MEWNMSRTPPWEVNQREDLDMDVEREKKGKKEKMLTIAHCANANKGDEARQGECKKCFMDAVKPKRSRNPRARVNNKEAIMTALTGCSEEFLAPAYDQC